MREYHYAIILRREAVPLELFCESWNKSPPQKKEEKRKNSTKGEGGGG